MTSEELDQWADAFAAFHARFAHLFVRSEPREQAVKYLRALMAPIARKNGWQMAEVMGDQTPDATQRLLYQADWDADAARDVYVQFVCETFGDADGIGVVDESGFIKKGTHSVGVKRQYSGTAGKVENCQIGTFLSYASAFGHVFVDRRLYLPEEWSADAERRAQAKVPVDVEFQTKPQQAMAMLESAWAHGDPCAGCAATRCTASTPSCARSWRVVGVGMCWRSASRSRSG
jgi:SRSO17 transposase